MKAIIVKYLGPTNTKPARLKVIAEGVKPWVIRYSYAEELSVSGDLEDIFSYAAKALKEVHHWQGELIGGGLPDNSGYVFVFKK